MTFPPATFLQPEKSKTFIVALLPPRPLGGLSNSR